MLAHYFHDAFGQFDFDGRFRQNFGYCDIKHALFSMSAAVYAGRYFKSAAVRLTSSRYAPPLLGVLLAREAQDMAFYGFDIDASLKVCCVFTRHYSRRRPQHHFASSRACDGHVSACH